jgi:LmbE family N-acetylglucosaminyl deacetylase
VTVWGESTVFVNIDDTIEIKIEALRAHKSQMGDWDPADMVRKWASDGAKGKEMTYAESYRVVSLVNDEEWAKTHSNGHTPEK